MLRRDETTDAVQKRIWLAIAMRAVSAGETVALQHFNYAKTNGFSYKKHGEIVTAVDLESNRAIIRVLKRLTPTIPILSEEGGDISESVAAKSELAWALDPIDGTTNFAARLPLWGISLALLHRGEPVLGVISLPALRHRYHAVQGGGAWFGKQRLHVSKTRTLKDAIGLLCYGYIGSEISKGIRMIHRFGKRVRSERVLGAAVVESVWVATGRADFSILHGVHTWDVAAGVLLVREAGGVALNEQGKRWTPNDSGVIFSNIPLVKPILKTLRA